jgi:hypothetical protein
VEARPSCALDKRCAISVFNRHKWPTFQPALTGAASRLEAPDLFRAVVPRIRSDRPRLRSRRARSASAPGTRGLRSRTCPTRRTRRSAEFSFTSGWPGLKRVSREARHGGLGTADMSHLAWTRTSRTCERVCRRLSETVPGDSHASGSLCDPGWIAHDAAQARRNDETAAPPSGCLFGRRRA